MATVRYERSPGDPARLTTRTRARLASLSDDQIEAAAWSDPNVQPLTEEQLDRATFRRDLRLSRAAVGLDVEGFASALGLPVETVEALERGEAPDPAARTLVRLLRRDPTGVLELLAA